MTRRIIKKPLLNVLVASQVTLHGSECNAPAASNLGVADILRVVVRIFAVRCERNPSGHAEAESFQVCVNVVDRFCQQVAGRIQGSCCGGKLLRGILDTLKLLRQRTLLYGHTGLLTVSWSDNW